MCLIISKPNGVKPDYKIMSQALADNPHGWGIMYADNNSIKIIKGIEAKAFFQAAKTVGTRQAVYHMRYKTHGELNVENCHPFQVTADIYMMHNGIISTASSLDLGMSDSYHFATYVLSPILTIKPELFGTKDFADIVSGMVGSGNKIVLLRSDGLLQIIGKGHERENCWYSNDNSFPYAVYEKSIVPFYSGENNYCKYPKGSYSSWVSGRQYKDSKLALSETDDYSYLDGDDPYSFEDMACLSEKELISFLRRCPEQSAYYISEYVNNGFCSETEGADYETSEMELD